ncbi:hypothetical protein Plhal304r1_c024g0081941 [Plasmopara halstedii]
MFDFQFTKLCPDLSPSEAGYKCFMLYALRSIDYMTCGSLKRNKEFFVAATVQLSCRLEAEHISEVLPACFGFCVVKELVAQRLGQ